MRKYYYCEIIKANIGISGFVFVILVGYGLMGNLNNWSSVIRNSLNVFAGSFVSIGFILSTVFYWYYRKNEKCMYFDMGISMSSLIIVVYILNVCIAVSILIVAATIL
jgi:hypothetical protein